MADKTSIAAMRRDRGHLSSMPRNSLTFATGSLTVIRSYSVRKPKTTTHVSQSDMLPADSSGESLAPRTYTKQVEVITNEKTTSGEIPSAIRHPRDLDQDSIIAVAPNQERVSPPSTPPKHPASHSQAVGKLLP